MNREDLATIDENIICFDGLDEAIIGYGYNKQSQTDVAIYDYDKLLNIFVEQDEMDVDEAIEYIAFNIIGLYAGDYTPIIMIREI